MSLKKAPRANPGKRLAQQVTMNLRTMPNQIASGIKPIKLKKFKDTKKNTKVCIGTHDNNDIITLHGGSDLDERVKHFFKNESNIQDSDTDIAQAPIMEDTANDFANCKNTGQPVPSALSQIVNDL